MPIPQYKYNLLGKFPATLEKHPSLKAKDLLQKKVYAVLPEAYKKFFLEWKYEVPEPVHYIPEPGMFKKNPDTNQVERVKSVPIPLMDDCPQMGFGIWGGESIVFGYRKRYCMKWKFDLPKAPHFWIPNLLNGVVYSEVLDKYMSCVLTRRAIHLINDNFGLDYYLLNTRACDLRNILALRLKRKILLALRDQTLYPDDEAKREEVNETYKPYLEKFTDEEIEWYGLTLEEATRKYVLKKAIEKEYEEKVPLKHQMRAEYIEYLSSGQWVPKKEEPWWKRKLISYK